MLLHGSLDSEQLHAPQADDSFPTNLPLHTIFAVWPEQFLPLNVKGGRGGEQTAQVKPTGHFTLHTVWGEVQALAQRPHRKRID